MCALADDGKLGAAFRRRFARRASLLRALRFSPWNGMDADNRVARAEACVISLVLELRREVARKRSARDGSVCFFACSFALNHSIG